MIQDLSFVTQGEHTVKIKQFALLIFPKPSLRELWPPRLTPFHWHSQMARILKFLTWQLYNFTVHNFKWCSEMMRAWRGNWMWHHDLFSCKFLTSFLKYQANDLLDLPKITLHDIPNIVTKWWISYQDRAGLKFSPARQQQENQTLPISVGATSPSIAPLLSTLRSIFYVLSITGRSQGRSNLFPEVVMLKHGNYGFHCVMFDVMANYELS